MSLRLSVVNQGAAKTYIMNYSALLDEMSDEGSPIDSTAAKVVFLEHITHPEYRTVVVDLSEGKYTLQDCYKRIGRVEKLLLHVVHLAINEISMVLLPMNCRQRIGATPSIVKVSSRTRVIAIV